MDLNQYDETDLYFCGDQFDGITEAEFFCDEQNENMLGTDQRDESTSDFDNIFGDGSLNESTVFEQYDEMDELLNVDNDGSDDPLDSNGYDESIVEFCDQFDELLQIEATTTATGRSNRNGKTSNKEENLKRKQLRYNRAVEGRRLHRKVERKRRRSRKAVANMELFKLDSELTLIIDLGYTNAMNNKELCKLVRQMGRVWGLQKRYVGLNTILLSPCEKFIGESRRVLTGFDSFKWTIMYKNIEQCSNKRLIYLSPDASLAPLESLSSNEAYVIGGLVDETGRGSLSKDRAESYGIEARRLPIVENMTRTDRGTFNVMLSINQVVEILARYCYTKQWKQTLAAVVPRRSGYVPIEESHSSNPS